MSYIGRQPTVGNFQICDAISVVNGQAAYTMQVGSVNVLPETANHMIVSLNGVIQKPNSSYTVAGAVITFSSNLVTGDVINFIQILGSVLDVGTVSDATITNAKTNFVSTSSAAGLQIKGDGTTDGTLQLNCSQNSHGIKIKSPPHSAGASYTLTMPNNDGDANQFLQTNGSGVLSFAAAGESNKPYFVAKMTAVSQNLTDGALYTINNYNSVNVDTCSGFNTSTGRYTPNVAGYYYVSFQTHATTSGGNMKMCYGQIFKNGSGGSSYSERAINQITFNTSFGEGANVGVENLIYLNGSSDYVYTAVVGDTNSGSAPAIAGESNYTWFRAFLVAAT